MFDEKKVVNQESKFANGGSREIMTTVPLLLFFILGVFGVSRGGGYRSVGGMNTSYSCDGELLDLTCPENLVIKVKIPPPKKKGVGSKYAILLVLTCVPIAPLHSSSFDLTPKY